MAQPQATTKSTNTTTFFVDGTKKLGEDLLKTGRNVFLAGLGFVAATEEQARKVFDDMVAKGEEYEKDEKRLVSRATREARELGHRVEERVHRTVTGTLNRAGVPSRDEIRDLTERVEALTHKVDVLASK